MFHPPNDRATERGCPSYGNEGAPAISRDFIPAFSLRGRFYWMQPLVLAIRWLSSACLNWTVALAVFSPL